MAGGARQCPAIENGTQHSVQCSATGGGNIWSRDVRPNVAQTLLHMTGPWNANLGLRTAEAANQKLEYAFAVACNALTGMRRLNQHGSTTPFGVVLASL